MYCRSPSVPAMVAAADPRLLPEPAPARLVEIDKLKPEEIAAAEQSAARIDFRKSATLLAHGDNAGFRAHDGGPFTSDLSGRDFWSLLHAG